MDKRARRRHDLQRMKAKAKRIGDIHGFPGNWDKLYDHLKNCSCEMCRNPRRSSWASESGKLTLQERRFEASAAS